MTGGRLQEAKAALERGRRVIVVAPPGVEHAEVVWAVLAETPAVDREAGPRAPAAVVICADYVAAAEWAEAAPPGRPVHAVSGLARTARLLEAGRVDLLAGAAKDLAALMARSTLKLAEVAVLVVAWPEGLVAGEHGAALDTLLAEAPDARRILLSWDPDQLADLIERHAHRAPMVGTPPRDAEGRPAPPAGPARFVVAPRERRAEQGAVLRTALDALDVSRPFLWRRAVPPPAAADAPDVILCLDLPSREEFASLAAAAPVVLFVSPAQLPYARAIARPLVPLVLPTIADRAVDQAELLAAELSAVIDARDLDPELALLAPLLERYDAAHVAAALLARRSAPAVPPGGSASTPAATFPPAGEAAGVKLFVTVGKRDRASAKDLVGALIREGGLVKEEIGRIEVRDTFSLVEVAPGAADRVLRRLAGATIRGRRIAVRRDRAGP